ncbi:MAG: cobalamin biosynthesis protein, partial [Egibacteraceae bacterium]
MMAALLAGWVADRALGDPRRGHPVAGFGRLAACLERALWRDDRLAGAVYAGILVGGPAAAVWAIQRRLDPRRRAVLL